MKHKYRPYFSTDEMLEVISALKETPTPKRMAMIKYLETFNLKIERGIIGHSLQMKPTLIERLELVDMPANETMKYNGESLYNKWKLSPKDCSPAEIESVMMYRWENDLMTPTEEQEYEDANGMARSPE